MKNAHIGGGGGVKTLSIRNAMTQCQMFEKKTTTNICPSLQFYHCFWFLFEMLYRPALLSLKVVTVLLFSAGFLKEDHLKICLQIRNPA